jgi:hypothetical protein
MHYDTTRALLSLATLAASTACAPGRPDDMEGVAEPLESPARALSGEPFLSSTEDGVVLSWLEQMPDGGHALWFARLGPDGWTDRRMVARGEDFFVNWADFPSVVAGANGSLWAHWLQREQAQGLAYGVRVARSDDGGVSWSPPWTPHEDGTPTEHGFVSLFPMGEEMGLAWLDGRGYAEGPDGAPPSREMSVRFRAAGADGPTRPERAVDTRTCDCCQTDVALASTGPVLVYRDRSEDEVRDIHVSRWDGLSWSRPKPVHEDGWKIAGCPVNGPAVAARGDRVVVAWFTAPGDAPEVRVAFSEDAARGFSDPARVDDGDPAGRVDVVLREDGSALVSWLERTGGDGAEVRIRRITGDRVVGPAVTVTASTAARASGFPRMVSLPWAPDTVLVAWTDVAAEGGARVRVAMVEAP